MIPTREGMKCGPFFACGITMMMMMPGKGPPRVRFNSSACNNAALTKQAGTDEKGGLSLNIVKRKAS